MLGAVAVAAAAHDASGCAAQPKPIRPYLAEKHPQVASSSLEELHREQVGWHRRWAEGMNQWLTKKGKTPDVNTAWPL